jgi:hypothetical protein
MGVIYGFNPPWGPAPAPAGSGRAVDRARATLFLRAQSTWLGRGLERAGDPTAVGIVLGAHDTSHESWLALIAALHGAGCRAAPAVAALYGFHGRIAGVLQHGTDATLGPVVQAELHAVLGARLRELTEAAIEAVEHESGTDTHAPAATHPPDPRPCGVRSSVTRACRSPRREGRARR